MQRRKKLHEESRFCVNGIKLYHNVTYCRCLILVVGSLNSSKIEIIRRLQHWQQQWEQLRFNYYCPEVALFLNQQQVTF